jgi:hypothetical protein
VDARTIAEDRPVSPDEIELVTWLLLNASTAGDLSAFVSAAGELRVVGRCSCGCPSVDFEKGGQAPPARVIADAYGETADGVQVGIILWGHEGRVTGLELYELAEPVRSLPVKTYLTPPPT